MEKKNLSNGVNLSVDFNILLDAIIIIYYIINCNLYVSQFIRIFIPLKFTLLLKYKINIIKHRKYLFVI